MRNAETDKRQFTGRHMLIVVCAFFAVVIAANATMAYFASRSWTGLVVPNSYVASQHYNEKLAAAQAQTARGWTSDLHYTEGELRLRIRSSDGTPVAGLQVAGQLERPIGVSEDRDVVLTETTPGIYTAATTLAAGAWNVTVDARRDGGDSYLQIFRLRVGKAG